MTAPHAASPQTQTDPSAEPSGDDAEVGRASVAELAERTPERRDRTVDALRALAIIVVVLWHWTFSVTHRNDEGQLVMPNPIGDVPGLWLGTWVLQVMPLFFIVGGYANLAGWDSSHGRGDGDPAFLASRARRLVWPAAVLLVFWAAFDLVRMVVAPEAAGVWHWGMIVFVPLWFLGTYLVVTALTPLTARLHRWAGPVIVVTLGAVVLSVDLLRLRHGIDGPVVFGVGIVGMVGSLLVWVFAHQLGFLWRDGAITRQVGASLTIGGLAALILLTNLGPYPRSLVAVRGAESNLFPTTAAVAALAVLQLGLIGLFRHRLARWLERPKAWQATIAVNSVSMTVFCWHMTALVGAIAAFEALGGTLGDRPTTSWWLTRPLWILGPALLLVPLVAVFQRFERR